MGETVEQRALPAEIDVNDGLRLRLLEPDDSERVFQILQSDTEIKGFITWTADLKSAEEIRHKIDEFQQNGENRYAMVEGDEVVGYIGIFPSRFHEGEYDLGYFCAPEKRGMGFVPAAAKSLMKVATEHLSVTSFALFIADHNKASQAVATKLDFRPTDETAYDEILNCVERRYVKPVAEIE